MDGALDFRSGGRWLKPDVYVLHRRAVSLDKKLYSMWSIFTWGRIQEILAKMYLKI